VVAPFVESVKAGAQQGLPPPPKGIP
jgi:hypothetical protein